MHQSGTRTSFVLFSNYADTFLDNAGGRGGEGGCWGGGRCLDLLEFGGWREDWASPTKQRLTLPASRKKAVNRCVSLLLPAVPLAGGCPACSRASSCVALKFASQTPAFSSLDSAVADKSSGSPKATAEATPAGAWVS